jgi:hypothetical protein
MGAPQTLLTPEQLGQAFQHLFPRQGIVVNQRYTIPRFNAEPQEFSVGVIWYAASWKKVPSPIYGATRLIGITSENQKNLIKPDDFELPQQIFTHTRGEETYYIYPVEGTPDFRAMDNFLSQNPSLIQKFYLIPPALMEALCIRQANTLSLVLQSGDEVNNNPREEFPNILENQKQSIRNSAAQATSILSSVPEAILQALSNPPSQAR